MIIDFYSYHLCPHDANNLGSIILEHLKKINLHTKLFAMTADNVGTNAAISRVIAISEGIDFDYDTQVHGCVAHTINLSDKDGLKVFGEVLDYNDAQHT